MGDLLVTQEFTQELIDPEWSLFDVLGPREIEIYLHHQGHHLNLLGKEGHRLYINDRGFITAVGCRSLTEEDLRAPVPVMITGLGRKNETEARESPLAARIMNDLANAPPLRCPAWKTILKTLSEMPSSQRTAEALVNLLQPAIDEEEEHWETLTTMRESLDIEEIVKISFEDVWDVIYALAEPEKRNDDTECDEWRDLHSIVTALNTIHDDIQGKYWGGTPWYTYDIERGINDMMLYGRPWWKTWNREEWDP